MALTPRLHIKTSLHIKSSQFTSFRFNNGRKTTGLVSVVLHHQHSKSGGPTKSPLSVRKIPVELKP